MKRIVPVVLVVGALALAACGSSSTKSSSGTTKSGSTGGSTTLQESGSSLMYPYLAGIASGFHAANPSVTLAPSPGGSGKGVSDAAAGTTDFGASDAYLSASQMAEYSDLENIPMVVSSQTVDYNLKGVTSLKLTGPILAEMYEGTITKWNDPAIAAINPGVTLPDTAVHPVHRSDSSGDTFLFTSFLSKTDPTFASKIGPNELPTWPSVPTSASASGNPGMVQTCQQTAGCVAYIGISASDSATAAGLGEAQLKNASGNFVSDSASTVQAAVAAVPSVPSSLAVSLIDLDGAQAYPIVNFEYIIVKKSPSKAAAIKTFLNYVLDPSGGSAASALAKDHFQALPSTVSAKSKAAVAGL